MLKTTTTNPAAPADQASSSAAEREQEQVRHRTALRIVGIEGIEVFADLADADADTSAVPPASQTR